MNSGWRVLLVAMAVGCLSVLGVVAAAQDGSATVTVFHAVPADDGFPADVYLNGDLIIDGFIFAASSDPAEIPAGDQTIEIYPEGADPSATEPAVADTVTLEANRNYSIIAQILDGATVLSVYVNDISPVDAGQARLTVRQASALPEVGVEVDGESLFASLPAASENTTDIDPGSHTVVFVSEEATVGEETVSLGEGALTVLYAVGADQETFGVLVQQIGALDTAPAGVPSGTGGLKARDPLAPVAVMVGVAGILIAMGLLVREKSI
ncbi:MAG: DUF4397 domain-containing protein [Acidimicrobiia bacterium]|nr:DUF4397 domain-containing protein [Acidimicrobiia bacterium]